MICKICNKKVKNKHALSTHVKLKHNINYLQYNVEFNEFIIPKCPFCGKDRIRRKDLEFNQTCGNKACISQNRSKKNKELLNNGMKEKISNSMKKAHVEGRAWNIGKSRWNNEPSYPEKFFIKVINNEFDDKNYIREYNVGKYSIDFAWIHKKIAIEIDGDQHYRFEEYKERDIKKDKHLSNKGWEILRIRWKDFYSNPQYYIKYCNDFINNKQKIEIDCNLLNNGKFIDTKKHNNIKYNKDTINFKIDEIKNSSINFNKQGWVNEVSNILKISPQKVTQWMRKNMYEFWDQNCFKRKGTKINN